MKKSLKLLAVLLSLCLLIGIVAVAASAAVEPEISSLMESQKTVNGATFYPSISYGSGSNSAGNSTVDKNAVDENGYPYVRYYGSGATQINTSGSFISISSGDTSASKVGANYSLVTAGVAKHTYAVFDYDFAADSYKVQVGYRLNTLTTTDKEVTNSDGSKSTTTTYTYSIDPAYALYSPSEISEQAIRADILKTYNALVELATEASIGSELITSKVKTVKDGKTTTENLVTPIRELGLGIDNLAQYEISYDEALETKSLALNPYDQIYLMGRYWQNATQTTRSDYSFGIYYAVDSKGDWYFYDNTIGKNTKIADMADEPGVYNHVTFILRYVEPAEGKTVGSVISYAFVNGVLVRTMTTENAYSFGVESTRVTIGGTKKTLGGHSYALSNVAINYYPAGYSSGDAYGIDEFFAGEDYKTKSLTGVTDVVYNRNYLSPNGYLRVNNGLEKGAAVSIPERVAEELAGIKDGSTVVTTMDILGLDVPDGVEEFDISCDPDKVSVTLSSDATAERFAVIKTKTGYTVSRDNSDITVYVKWLDIKGNVITTTPLFFGNTPDASGIVANSYDDKTGIIYHATVSGWTWDLDGEVRDITSDMAEAGTTVTMTPTVSGEITSVEGARFYMGVRYDDTLVTAPVPASNGTFTYYKTATATQVLEQTKLQTYGNTCVLLTDYTGEDGNPEAYPARGAISDVPAGKTVNFDLNGHVFVKEGVYNSFGNAFFRLNEGASVNIYSMKAGGRILMGNIRPSAVNLITNSSGIVVLDKGIDKATCNIGAPVNARGEVLSDTGDNFSYIGGTLVQVSGYKNDTDANKAQNAKLKNENKITINVNGGYYYAPYRSSYAFVCIQAPDVVINVDGGTFVSAYQTSSGLFHDYNEYAACTVATVKNAEIYSMKVDSNGVGSTSGGLVNIINRMESGSRVYFENCILVGRLASAIANGAKIEFGPGNTLVETSGMKLFSNSAIVYSSGTSYATPSAYKYSKTVLHPNANAVWEHDMILTYPDGAAITGAVDTQAEAELLTGAHFKKSVWTEYVNCTFAANVSIVTYDENNIPDVLASVEWRSVSGELLATTYELIDTAPLPPEAVTSIVGSNENYKWFVKGYSWSSDEGMIVKEGVNVFTPTPFYTAKIKGIKVNVTLFEDVVYNLYLPVTDTVSEVSVTGAELSGKTTTIGDTEYYVVRSRLAVDEFAPVTCTVSFKAEGTKTITQNLTIDLLAYATVVSESYTCGSEEARLVYEMLSYKDAVASAADSSYTAPENLETFFAAHESCDCITEEPTLSESELNVDYSALSENGVNAVAYMLTLGDIGIAIYTDGTPVDSVSYTDDFGRSITHTVADGSIKAREGYYLVTGVSAANINSVMTISVGGASGTYSLAKYIQNNPEVAVARSLYKYAVASENYKCILESESDKLVYNKMQSVLLIGQSNMTSSNNLYEAIQIEDDRLFMMRDYSWVKMQEPIHTGSSLYGAGIGATFGKAFVETFDVNLGLIPAAKGGTTLADWAVGGELYTRAVNMAKAAQETSEICAILWHQGEGDQYNTQYAALLQVIFDAMIEELGLDPDKIVIITGELFGTRSDAIHMPQLIELGKHYKNYGIALSDGLTVRDVTTHFDAPSMRVFGYRYFDIFYNLTRGKHYYFDQNPEHYKAVLD